MPNVDPESVLRNSTLTHMSGDPQSPVNGIILGPFQRYARAHVNVELKQFDRAVNIVVKSLPLAIEKVVLRSGLFACTSEWNIPKLVSKLPESVKKLEIIGYDIHDETIAALSNKKIETLQLVSCDLAIQDPVLFFKNLPATLKTIDFGHACFPRKLSSAQLETILECIEHTNIETIKGNNLPSELRKGTSPELPRNTIWREQLSSAADATTQVDAMTPFNNERNAALKA